MICTPILPPSISLIKILVVRLSMFHVSVSIHGVSDRFTSDNPDVYIGGFCYENALWYRSSIPNKFVLAGGTRPCRISKECRILRSITSSSQLVSSLSVAFDYLVFKYLNYKCMSQKLSIF